MNLCKKIIVGIVIILLVTSCEKKSYSTDNSIINLGDTCQWTIDSSKSGTFAQSTGNTSENPPANYTSNEYCYDVYSTSSCGNLNVSTCYARICKKKSCNGSGTSSPTPTTKPTATSKPTPTTTAKNFPCNTNEYYDEYNVPQCQKCESGKELRTTHCEGTSSDCCKDIMYTSYQCWCNASANPTSCSWHIGPDGGNRMLYEVSQLQCKAVNCRGNNEYWDGTQCKVCNGTVEDNKTRCVSATQNAGCCYYRGTSWHYTASVPQSSCQGEWNVTNDYCNSKNTTPTPTPSSGYPSSGSNNACYKNNTDSTYVYGNYSKDSNYTKVSVSKDKCNSIKLKKVDDTGNVISGATFTLSQKNNNNTLTQINTYSAGEVLIEQMGAGNYVLKETIAPAGYQLDSTDINITIDSNGIVSVNVTNSNIDLGTTNMSNNVVIALKNISTNSTPTPAVDEKCYIKRGNGTDNMYCYGTKEKCSTYEDEIMGKNATDCTEDTACYKKTDGTYVTGKYDGQTGYTYAGSMCPMCYKNSSKVYRWTSDPTSDETIDYTATNEESCIKLNSSKTFNFDIKKIIIIILIIVLIIVAYKMLKPSRNNQRQEF